MTILQPIVYKPTQETLLRIIQDETKLKNVSLVDIKAETNEANVKDITMIVVESEIIPRRHSNGCDCDDCYLIRQSGSINKNALQVKENGKRYGLTLRIYEI